MLTEVEVGLASVRWWCKKFPPVYRYRVEWEMILVVITCLVAGLDRRTWHKQCDARVTATHNGTSLESKAGTDWDWFIRKRPSITASKTDWAQLAEAHSPWGREILFWKK